MRILKRKLIRIFSMDTRDLIILCIKISFLCLFSLYFFNFICDYIHGQLYENTRQVLVNVHENISKKSQKNMLDTDYNETSLALNCAKNQCINNNSVVQVLNDYAKQSNVSIQSYVNSEPIYRESYQKITVSYKLSGNLQEIAQ